MAHETEAACLLRTGAQFPRRVGLRDEVGNVAFAGVSKHATFSLYFGDEPIDHFDLEGRWQRTYRGGVHYRKGLNGSIDAIERPREGKSLVLRRRRLSFAEAADLDDAIRASALDLLAAVGTGRCERIDPPSSASPLEDEELLDLLERIGRWDASAWFAQREVYLATYGPIEFLPPDCHGSIVLQATLGHRLGRAFGHAPAAAPCTRDLPEFTDHCRVVRDLLGRRAEQSRCIFLGGPEILRLPPDQIAIYLTTIAHAFPEPGLHGVDAFLDEFAGPLPSRDDWRLLAGLGLRHVNLGVESGDPTVRALHGKNWRDDDLRSLVAVLTEAGIGVRIVVLVGAGGAEHTERHVAATAGLVHSLGLSRGQFVYLIDAREVGDPTLGGLIGGLDLTALAAQETSLKEALASLRKENGVVVTPYRLDKQWV